jgi:hypothetical protein
MPSVVEGGKLAFLHRSPSRVLVSPSDRSVWFCCVGASVDCVCFVLSLCGSCVLYQHLFYLNMNRARHTLEKIASNIIKYLGQACLV